MPPSRLWSVFLDWVRVKNLHRILLQFLFQGQDPSSVLFLVLFKGQKSFSGLFNVLFLKIEKMHNNSNFRVHFFLLFSSSFSPFFMNLTLVPRTFKVIPRFLSQSISEGRTLPRSFWGSFSVNDVPKKNAGLVWVFSRPLLTFNRYIQVGCDPSIIVFSDI